MKKILCTVLTVLLVIVSAAFVSRTQAESADAFQPRLDPDTECTITVIGSYKNFEALEAEFVRFTRMLSWSMSIGMTTTICWERYWKARMPRTSSSPINGCAEIKNTRRSAIIWRIFQIRSWAWTWPAFAPAL